MSLQLVCVERFIVFLLLVHFSYAIQVNAQTYDLQIETDVPLLLTVKAGLNYNDDYIFRIVAGTIPELYVDAANSINRRISNYNSEQAKLISVLWPNSIVAGFEFSRVNLGISKRWSINLGVSYIEANVKTTGKEVFEAVFEENNTSVPGSQKVEVSSLIIMGSIGIKYRFTIKDNSSNWSLGFKVSHPLDSNTQLNITGSGTAANNFYSKLINETMHELYLSMWTPSITLSASQVF